MRMYSTTMEGSLWRTRSNLDLRSSVLLPLLGHRMGFGMELRGARTLMKGQPS